MASSQLQSIPPMAPSEANTNVQTGRLAALETIIENGMRTFIEVGTALLEIRDRRLYREQGFTTFEDYCLKRWEWTHRHVNRQIAAAEVVRNLGPIGPKPLNEAQARELVRLSPEQQIEVAATIDFTKATAAEIREQAYVQVQAAAAQGKMPLPKAARVAHQKTGPRYSGGGYLDAKTKLLGKIHDVTKKYPQKAADLRAAIIAAVTGTTEERLFCQQLHKELMHRRREADLVNAKRMWNPDAICKMDLVDILTWVGDELRSYINGREGKHHDQR